jgi:hypothetical protein
MLITGAGPSKKQRTRDAFKRRRVIDDSGGSSPIEDEGVDAGPLTPSRKKRSAAVTAAAVAAAAVTSPAAVRDVDASPSVAARPAALPPVLERARALAAARAATPGRFQWDVPDVALLLKGLSEHGRAPPPLIPNWTILATRDAMRSVGVQG